MKTFILDISGSIELTEKDLWPDGDAPNNPTKADVRALLKKSGGLKAIINDWNLEGELDIEIYEDQPL